MKKGRKLKLEVKKVCVSKLNNILGGDDIIESVNAPCIRTTIAQTIPDEDCKTVITIINRSLRKC